MAEQRLIDANALMRDVEHYHLSDGKFQYWIEIQPTIEERKTGMWIRITQGATPEKYMCPFCHRTVEHEGVEYFVSMMYPFCHCGADMRGEEDARTQL